MDDVERARELMVGAHSVVVLTGAGVSTDSGIPDFRGPDGVWTKDPGAEMLSDFATYQSNQQIRERAWQHRLNSTMWDATPNRCHLAFVELETTRRLQLLVTQNIDGLHLEAGTCPDLLVEIHGNVRDVVCLRCGAKSPMRDTLVRVAAGTNDPRCERVDGGLVCGGILKSATISFGQSLDHHLLERAMDAASTCDLLLTAGTSLAVYPIASMVEVAASRGAHIIIANGEPTALDSLASVVVRGPLNETLVELVRD